jgi:hypothetical protein
VESVKVVQDVYVEATGASYKAGDIVEVSDELAERHLETGCFEAEPVELQPAK